MKLSPESIAAGVARALARVSPEAAAPAAPASSCFVERAGPRLPLPDLSWHGDLPGTADTDPATVARVARSIAAARASDELERIRDSLRPDFATSVARAAARRAAQAEAERERPSPALRAARLAAGVREMETVLEPAPRPTPTPAAVTPSSPADAARTAEALAEVEARIERLRADLALRDDAGAGTRALRGESRRVVHNSLKLLVNIRARLMLPDTAARRVAAVEEFKADSEAQTGMSMSVEQYGEQMERRLKLSEMAREICRRLEEAGVTAYRDAGDVKLWRYFIHTELLEELPQYRRICINPAIAAQSRANILASLEYFIQEHPFCRFWTFTTGRRCFARDIPARLDEFYARLRKLNSWMRKTFRLEIVLRSTEFGTLEMHEDGQNRAEENQGRIRFEMDPETFRAAPTYHPHFHLVVYSLSGYRTKDKWTELCRRVRARWGHMVDFGEKGESGVIQNAREIVKYVTKPGDVLKLDLPQLREFYEATANRRLVRPMGSLQADIARRRAAEKSLVRRRLKAGVWKWREVDDHNKTLSSCESPEERAAADEQADANAFDHEMRLHQSAAPDWRWADEVTTVYAGEITRTASHREPVGGRPVPLRDLPSFCKVVAFMRPAAGPTRRKENCVMVMGNVLDMHAVRTHPLVDSLHARTVDAWRAGEAMAAAEEAAGRSGIFLDTGTVSVPDPHPGGSPGKPPRAVQLHFEQPAPAKKHALATA